MRRQELQHLYVEMTLDSMLLEELQMFVADTISKQLDTLNNEQMISEFYKSFCYSPEYLYEIGRSCLTESEIESFLAATTAEHPA